MILINAPLCRERVIRHSNEALLLLPLHKHSKNVLSAKPSRAPHRQPDTLHREGTFKIFNRDGVLNFIPLTWEPQLSFSLAASQSGHGGERYGKRAKPGHMCVRNTGRAMPILCGESPGIAFLSRSVVSHSTSALALIDALVCLSSRREWNAGQMVSPCPPLWITLTDRQGVNSHAQTHTHTAYVHMNTISDTHTHTAAETAYTIIIIIIEHPRGF